jgi:hypothetical protein
MTQLTLFNDPPKSTPAHSWNFTLWRQAADKAQELNDSGEWKDIRLLHNPEDTKYYVKAVKN